ncbi:homeodomain-like protein [Tanacetum coccineum]
MSIILHERLSGNLQRSIKIKPRVNDETIYTSVKADKPSICRIDASQYAGELKEANGEKDPEAYYTDSKPLGKTLPRKKKDPRNFTLPCFIKNMCYKALADLGASVSVMPYSTYTTLGLGDFIPTKLIVKLANMSHPSKAEMRGVTYQ